MSIPNRVSPDNRVVIAGREWRIDRYAKRGSYRWYARHNLPLLAKPLNESDRPHHRFSVGELPHPRLSLSQANSDGEILFSGLGTHYRPTLTIGFSANLKKDDISEAEFAVIVGKVDAWQIEKDLVAWWAEQLRDFEASDRHRERSAQFDQLVKIFAEQTKKEAEAKTNFAARLAGLHAEFEATLKQMVASSLEVEDDWTWSDGNPIDPAVIQALKDNPDKIVKFATNSRPRLIVNSNLVPSNDVEFKEQENQ